MPKDEMIMIPNEKATVAQVNSTKAANKTLDTKVNQTMPTVIQAYVTPPPSNKTNAVQANTSKTAVVNKSVSAIKKEATLANVTKATPVNVTKNGKTSAPVSKMLV